ncbi:MAG: hypothetical protein PVG99_13930 [Desulfobacteraceae bacterium]
MKRTLEEDLPLILPIETQIKAWHLANRKMAWGISRGEFEDIEEPPSLTENDRHDGFLGVALFYGLGDDGSGNADSVFSGKMAWEYARKRRKPKMWQCQYIHFDEPEHIRLRPAAPPRPKGFYYAKFQPGKRFQALTVSQVRKRIEHDTCCGPEGIQFLVVTHSHFQRLMNERKFPFMALADYDVAPYGYSDFFDVPQIFCSNGILGMGVGHVDRNYPLFGIPTLRFQ